MRQRRPIMAVYLNHPQFKILQNQVIDFMAKCEQHNWPEVLASDICSHLRNTYRWKGLTSREIYHLPEGGKSSDDLDYIGNFENLLEEMGFSITRKRHGAGLKAIVNL